MRILVTGSRDWTDEKAVYLTLVTAAMTLDKSYALGNDVTLVHGACSSGADEIAERVGVTRQWTIEPWPADWKLFGKRAGFVRNQEMVQAGAEICLAYIKGGSAGATMTADMAEKAGIPVLRYSM